jgi:uncharacterized protein YkwD
MRRRTGLIMVVALVAVLLSPVLSPLPASAGPDNPGGDEAAFVSMINSARAKQGVAPLKVDGELTALARDWAAEMAGGTCGQRPSDGRNGICHASSLSAGVSADWVKLGENVGMGGDVQAVMQGFLNSSGHYKNLMDPAFTRIGVGVVWSENGALYTTHRFMQVAGESATPPKGSDDTADKGEDAAPPTSKPSRSAAPKNEGVAPSAPPATEPPPTTTTTPPPVAEPSRVAVVLQALHSASR